MNNELFQQAKQAFGARDFQAAADLFAQCLADPDNPPAQGELGLLNHQLGNCLMKTGAFGQAIEAYAQAAADTAYDACGTVNCNMGMAYAQMRDWEGAVKHFEIAVSDRTYPTPYKAYTGMGNALMKQGKSAEAGVAFREAALDASNPDPTKALLNLGVCFMALNRPADAVASYESALQFDMSADTRNKLYASLGQAYVASGQMEKGVDAFERALEDKTYFLSASASVDYQRAVAAVSQGNSDLTQALPAVADTSGFDVVAANDERLDVEGEPEETPEELPSEYYFTEEYDEGGNPEEAQERFFNASDAELERWSRDAVKKERKRKSVGLKVFVVILVIILLAVLAAGFLYWRGYGLPTQAEDVAAELFQNPTDKDLYVQEVTDEDIASYAALIPEGATVTVDGVQKSMRESTAYVTATTPEGAQIRYEVQLRRGSNFVSWKAGKVKLYFSSTSGQAQ